MNSSLIQLKRSLLIASISVSFGCKNTQNQNGRPTNPAPAEAIESQSKHIIGGQETVENSVLALRTVAILNSSKKMRCTGTLITKNLVLTAAHCFADGTNNNDMSISFGIKAGSGEQRKVSQIVTHAQYRSGATLGESAPLYDVALVRFDPVAPDSAQLAAVPGDEVNLAAGAVFNVAGFGWSWSNPSSLLNRGGGEGTLREVNLILTSVLDRSFQLKFVSPSKAVCSGDSGGPAFFSQSNTLYVSGVTSWGYSRCEDGLSVFSDVRKFKAWISEKATSLNSPLPVSGQSNGGGTIPAPTPTPPGPTVTPSPLAGPVATEDQRILQEAQNIYRSIQSGFINQQVKEIAYKNANKYDRRSWLLFKNTAPQYRCVNIKGTGESWGIQWGMTNGPFVYYDNIRISKSSSFDAVNCLFSASWGRAHWYLDN